jgi:hypothetical protein
MPRHRARPTDQRRYAVVICGECEKRTYNTKAEARRAADDIERNNASRPWRTQLRDVPLRGYRCPVGNGFHVGHPAVPTANLNDPRLSFLPGQA